MSWQRIKGHDIQIEEFRRAVRRGRLAHAYLFTGLSGVGKRLFAVELAKALLCETPASEVLAACDHCPSCIQVDAGTHPDFAYARRPDDALEFPIELMRELCKGFGLKSARGRGRIVVLDDVDDLNEESANCFLKTLEEPPARAVLILIGSSAERQLQTIVSRCQVVRFAPLSPSIINDILQANGIADAPTRDRLARLSGGSAGLALALADPALATFRRTLVDGIAQAPLDSVGLAAKFMEFVEEAGKESAAQRARAQLVVRLLIDFFDDALSICTEGVARRTESADRAALDQIAARLNPEDLLAVLDRCLDADAQIERRVQLVLVVEALLDALGQQMRSPAGAAS